MLIERYDKNPILTPKKEHSWEAEAVFNGCPVKKKNKIYLVYRAVSLSHYHVWAQRKLQVSDIGIADSKDGINFHNRRRFIIPEYSWERFGCEDPRVTKLENKYYIFYTALSEYPFKPEGIRVGLAISKNLKTIEEKHLITPFNAKAMVLFPEKINGKIWAVLTPNTDRPPSKIGLASFDQEKDMWNELYWQNWYGNFLKKYSLPLQRRPEDQVEVGTAPIKTKNGWLLIYSYIRNYFSGQRLFSIEAVLLDLKNPLKIIGRTMYPLMTPEEYYERIGLVPNVVFPSGALLEKNKIKLYYGAADTTCCLATISLDDLLDKIMTASLPIKSLWSNEKKIIEPDINYSWKAKAVFNPAAIYLAGKVHLLYRAQATDNTSVFGYAQSQNGLNIDYLSPEPVYVPREPFEQKLVSGGNSGCEDPRLTKIGDKIYMTYVAFDGTNPPRVALTSITVSDFLNQKWNWAKPVLISPPGFDDKDAGIFPEKIQDQYAIIHRSGNDVDLSLHKNLNFDGQTWLEEYRWFGPRPGFWDSKKVGLAAPPIKIKEGWLVLYHGVSDDNIYRVGAILADFRDPANIIARTDEPIFEPRKDFEKIGQISNVVFPCGAVIIDKKLFMYYGGGDTVVGVAAIKLEKLLKILKNCKC